MLERRGWRVVPQIGVSGFRVDLGICHPDHAGIFVADIECDGATYHSPATARDRDKLREQVLRGLGWTILRVWSTDWWFNAQGAVERLHAGLEKALADSRQARAGENKTAMQPSATVKEDDAANSSLVTGLGEIKVADLVSTPADAHSFPPFPSADRILSASEEVSQAKRVYSPTDLSAFAADPDCFFEFSYRNTLQAMVDAVIENEAPLREDILGQRIARAHGWLPTDARIRDEISHHLRRLDRTEESSRILLRKPGTVAERVPFRQSQSEVHRRALSDICLAELVDFVLSNTAALEEPDAPLVYARLLELARLAASSRARLEEAINSASALATA